MKLERVGTMEMQSRFRDVKYMLAGALYGLLIGTMFVISAATVDRLLYPDLSLGMDWSLFLARWVWIALGLALTGAVACLFTEKMPSLLLGSAAAGIVTLVSALFFSTIAIGLKVMLLVFLLLPAAAVSLPLVLILRWLVDRHEQALEEKHILRWVLPLVLLAIVLGLGSGCFMKMSRRALQAVRFMHEVLQTTPDDMQSQVRDLPGFQSHADQEFRLFQTASETSTEGYDVRAEYEDGYSLNCVIVVYPGSNPYISECTSSQE